MSARHPLFWQQGLFLQPQHFQLMEQSFRDLIAPTRQLMTPHFWGVVDLQIRQTRLANRIFELQSGSFIYPDGTCVDFPGHAVMSGRSFDESWSGPLNVYLGLKIWTDAGVNVTVVDNLETISRVTTRFVTTPNFEEVQDLHAGGPAGRVKKLYYVLKLLWESELQQSSDYLHIPIARLQRIGADVRLSPDFIPPCPVISGSESLMNALSEIRDQITARGRQLEEYKKKRSVHSAEFGSRDMVYILALRSLNRYVPLLQHYTQTPQIHPWVVYGALRQLAGELSSFSERINALGELSEGGNLLPRYDHTDLWGCYFAAQNLISHLLDEITAGPEHAIRLAKDGVFYGADLKSAVFEGRNRFYLSVRTEEQIPAVLQSFKTVVKLGSREDLQNIVSRALPGIVLEHQAQPPQELPRRSNTHYFLVNHSSDLWESVMHKKNIALYWNSAPLDLEVELLVIGRS